RRPPRTGGREGHGVRRRRGIEASPGGRRRRVLGRTAARLRGDPRRDRGADGEAPAPRRLGPRVPASSAKERTSHAVRMHPVVRRLDPARAGVGRAMGGGGSDHGRDPADLEDPSDGMTSESADLAVVVVNYNTGDYLARSLRSVQECAGDARLEIVVVDNASRDESAAKAVREHPQAKLISHRSNRVLAAAVNQRVRATGAPFVLLLNPDAEVVSGTLGGFVKIARDRPRAGAVGPL